MYSGAMVGNSGWNKQMNNWNIKWTNTTHIYIYMPCTAAYAVVFAYIYEYLQQILNALWSYGRLRWIDSNVPKIVVNIQHIGQQWFRRTLF